MRTYENYSPGPQGISSWIYLIRLFQKIFFLSFKKMFWIFLLFLHTRTRTDVIVATTIKTISTTSIEPISERRLLDSPSISFSFMDVLLNSSLIGSVSQSYGINSPRAITRNDEIAIMTFGGYLVFHSVKKTTNCKVFIMPHSIFKDDPRIMFKIVLPFIKLRAPAIAEFPRSSIFSSSSGSIYRGKVTFKGSSSLIIPKDESNEIKRESGVCGF